MKRKKLFLSFFLSLREGLEATLLIGIVLGALRKTNHQELRPAIWPGTISAFLVSFVTALVFTMIGAEMEGNAEKICEGITMLFAAGVLTWMIFWMQGQTRNLKMGIEQDIRRATL